LIIIYLDRALPNTGILIQPYFNRTSTKQMAFINLTTIKCMPCILNISKLAKLNGDTQEKSTG